MEKVLMINQKAKKLRKTILEMIHAAKSGHPGGSLSLADIFATLYYHEMNIDPNNPEMPDRDRLVLSKGHACPVMYSVLAMKGFFPWETIYTLRKKGSILQGHPDMRKVPGVDMTTGSLGQGLSLSVGMAFGQKARGYGAYTYAILGDGELNEGQIWEAAMLARKYNLSNLIAIVDCNGLQLDGTCDDIMPMDSIADKWLAFGWRVLEMDGHNVEDILKTLEEAKKDEGKPVCIIANTVKGKGVSFMEDKLEWHGNAPNDEQFAKALEELGEVE